MGVPLKLFSRVRFPLFVTVLAPSLMTVLLDCGETGLIRVGLFLSTDNRAVKDADPIKSFSSYRRILFSIWSMGFRKNWVSKFNLQIMNSPFILSLSGCYHPMETHISLVHKSCNKSNNVQMGGELPFSTLTECFTLKKKN